MDEPTKPKHAPYIITTLSSSIEQRTLRNNAKVAPFILGARSMAGSHLYSNKPYMSFPGPGSPPTSSGDTPTPPTPGDKYIHVNSPIERGLSVYTPTIDWGPTTIDVNSTIERGLSVYTPTIDWGPTTIDVNSTIERGLSVYTPSIVVG